MLVEGYFFSLPAVLRRAFRPDADQGVDDVDIPTSLRSFDHTACQIGYLDRILHIEDNEFVVFTHDGSLEHQATGLGYHREITDDVGV